MAYEEGGFTPEACAVASWALLSALMGDLIREGVLTHERRDDILQRAARALPEQADPSATQMIEDARRLLLASRSD